MKLDAQVLRYLTRDDFRVLTAIEMGMKNHELVPTTLICAIAALQQGPGAAFKIINTLHRNKLIYHECKKYDGYRLTYLGYDYLALRTYVARGLITGLGRRIGVGKEADIYECCNEAGETMVLKIHRLGRISFRQIKNKRDYLLHRKNASWMYMSRLAAIREFTYMKALYDHGFPVPIPYDQNRHTILMSFIDAYPFGQIREISQTGKVYSELLNLIIRLADHGLIHADFNEFNLLIDDNEKITLIDFPQMVSTHHPEAKEFFERDVACITRYFTKRFGFIAGDFPKFERDIDESKRIDLDRELAASGHNHSLGSNEQRQEFEKFIAGKTDASVKEAIVGEDEEREDNEGNDDVDDDGTYEDEEALAASLGIDANDLHGSDQFDANETEQLRQELDGVFESQEKTPSKRSTTHNIKKSTQTKSTTSASSQQLKSDQPSLDDDNDDNNDNDIDDDVESARHHAARMARKDARQKSHAQSQALKQARKAQEKERKKAEREGTTPTTSTTSLITTASSTTSTTTLVPKDATIPPIDSSSSTLTATTESVSSVDDGDDAVDVDDTASIHSSAASLALSQLGLNSKNLLNIQLPKPQQRLKRANKNKDRETRKLHASLKEHL